MWKKIEHKSYIRTDTRAPSPCSTSGAGLPRAGRPSGRAGWGAPSGWGERCSSSALVRQGSWGLEAGNNKNEM